MESETLTTQFRERLQPLCERHGAVQLSRSQYEAVRPDEGLLVAQSAHCTGQPDDTEASMMALFVSNMELTGLRAQTGSIYCSITEDGAAVDGLPGTQYTARVYEF